MDLRQLRYFVGIVQVGSLSRAADQLHVAQSALSHHLASLEAELDTQLVIRGRKGIALTEAGSILYRHAQTILRQLEAAKQATKNALNRPSGRVSVGFPGVLAPLLSYELFKRVRAEYPQIVLHVIDSNSAVVRERLVNGRLDIAVLYADERERGFAVEPLASEELFYVTADPDQSAIRIADAARRPLLMPGPGSTCRRVAEEAFKTHELAVTSIGEINTLSALHGAISAGIGNAILSWAAAACNGDQRKALNCRRIADERLMRPVALCFSEVGQRSPAVDAVAKTLKSLVRELVESGSWRGVSLIEASREPAHALVSQQKAGRTPIRRSSSRALLQLETQQRQAGRRP